jgi:hypothetical protein
MRWHVVGNQRAVLLLARAPLLLGLCCGPAVPEHKVVQGLDGREYRLLSTQEVASQGGPRVLRIDFESGAFEDPERRRKEARALVVAFRNNLARRQHVMIVANSERSDPWSDQREQFAFLFARSDAKWEIVVEDEPALALSRLD